MTNIVGASIGRTALFDLDEVANIIQAVCLIRLNTSLVLHQYLITLMNSEYFISKLFSNKVENARANVSMGNIGQIQIPLPPLEVQKKFL